MSLLCYDHACEFDRVRQILPKHEHFEIPPPLLSSLQLYNIMLRRSIFLEFNNSLRRYSTAAQPGGEANSIAAWIQSITAQAPKIAHDLVDVERAGHLHRTLPTRTRTPVPVEGDVLRKGHHLVYMQPRGELVDLGEDGSSTVRRRRWDLGVKEIYRTEAL